MAIRIEVGYRSGVRDPRGEATQETIGSFLGFAATVRSFDAYTIDAQLQSAEVERIRALFTDAVTQRSAVG
jgi:phosphoribosylformylglycinamidine (FGAM) synthase PurS component